jgi:hypothetical protein
MTGPDAGCACGPGPAVLPGDGRLVAHRARRPVREPSLPGRCMMIRLVPRVLVGPAAVVAAFAGFPAATTAQQPPQPGAQLTAFEDAAGIVRFLDALAVQRCGVLDRARGRCGDDAVLLEAAVAATGFSSDARASITNVQHAGVDEGGIVKLHGDHLIVLRRGRLFTVDIGAGRLTPISASSRAAPGTTSCSSAAATSSSSATATSAAARRSASSRSTTAAGSTIAPPISSARTTTIRRATTRAASSTAGSSSTRR